MTSAQNLMGCVWNSRRGMKPAPVQCIATTRRLPSADGDRRCACFDERPEGPVRRRSNVIVSFDRATDARMRAVRCKAFDVDHRARGRTVWGTTYRDHDQRVYGLEVCQEDITGLFLLLFAVLFALSVGQ